MSDKHPLVLIGYSGHGYVVAEAAISAGHILQYYAERMAMSANPFDLEYLGFDGEEDFSGWGKKYGFILGVGDNISREKIAVKLASRGELIVSVTHPQASVSAMAVIGVGVLIARNVSVNPMVRIADYVILNTGSIIEHECTIGQSAHIAPGAVLSGNVKVGERSFIGANSVVKQGIRIGKDVIIGAGSVVIRDVPDNHIIFGNPARKQIK